MMYHCVAAVVLVLLGLSVLQAQESTDVPDSFLIFERFPVGVAIFDSDNDTIFECLRARRTFFNKEAKRTQYVWFLHDQDDNSKSKIIFNVAEGSTPDTFVYKEVSGGEPPKVGTLYYTDYENCGVFDIPFHGNQCMLWAPAGKEDDLPEDCVKQFTKYCGVGTLDYNKKLCKNEDAQ